MIAALIDVDGDWENRKQTHTQQHDMLLNINKLGNGPFYLYFIKQN